MQLKSDSKTTWQPIETAPKDGTKVLLWDERPIIGAWLWVIGDFYAWDAGASGSPQYEIGKPTHWMPLPEPPET